ncbi:MAG: glycosyltransferase family 4 protein [Mobilitalea sp.]
MKILMVNKFLYPNGGAETYFFKVGKFMEMAGHQVEYFGMYHEKNIVTNSANEYTTEMDFHTSGMEKFFYPMRIIYSFEAKRKIRNVIEKFKPDIVHLNNINFQLTPAIIEEIHKQGIPMVQTVHDYQMICPNHLMFDIHTKKPCELCLYGSKWNCTRKNCIASSKIKSAIGSIEAILYRQRKTYQLVDLYICPSHFLEDKLYQSSQLRGKTVTIQNFIELKKIEEFNEKDDYVLYFGRLSEEKGLEMFLNCCKKLSHIKFKVAGTGPLVDKCLGIPNVEFVGFKTGEELDTLIRRAKFSVYPSIWYENSPLSILESKSLGTPVIASKMGGIPELIENNETGIIIEDISEEKLTNEINALYQDNEKIMKMSKNCIEKREKMISLETYGSRILEVYNKYIKKDLN